MRDVSHEGNKTEIFKSDDKVVEEKRFGWSTFLRDILIDIGKMDGEFWTCSFLRLDQVSVQVCTWSENGCFGQELSIVWPLFRGLPSVIVAYLVAYQQ